MNTNKGSNVIETKTSNNNQQKRTTNKYEQIEWKQKQLR